MKVLMFCNSPGIAYKYLNLVNAEPWVSALEEKLKKEDIQIAHVFNHSNYIEPFEYDNIQFYPVFVKRSKYSVLYRRVFAKIDNGKLLEYKKIIEEFEPDLIHIHGTEGPFGQVINSTTIPCVISIQGLLNVYQGFFKKGIKQLNWKSTSIKDTLFFKSPLSRFKLFMKLANRETIYLQKAKYIIGRTDWDRRVSEVLCTAREYYHVDEILRKVFYNTTYKRYNSSEKEIRLISVLRPNYYKGFDDVLRASQLLHSKGLFFIWSIVGVEPNDKIWNRYIKDLKVKDEVLEHLDLKGRVEEDAIVKLMCESDIYIHPSHIENSSNAIGEAMLIGMPIIASNSGGTSSLLDNNKQGLIVQVGDFHALAGAILELYHQPAKRKLLGINAKAKANQRHSSKKILDNLLSTYNSILNSNEEGLS